MYKEIIYLFVSLKCRHCSDICKYECIQLSPIIQQEIHRKNMYCNDE